MSKEAWGWGHSSGNRKHEFEFLAEGIINEKLSFPLFLGATNSVHCRLHCNVSALVQLEAKGKTVSSNQLCCQVSDQADQNGFFQGSSSFRRQAGGDTYCLRNDFRLQVGCFPKLLGPTCTWCAPHGLCQHKLLLRGWDGWVLNGQAVQLVKPLQWHTPLLQGLSCCRFVAWIKAKKHKGTCLLTCLIS